MTRRHAPRRGPLLGAAAALTAACTLHLQETVHGSGNPASEIRTVDPFLSLYVSDGLEVEVEVEVGTGPLVTVHGDDNLLPYVTAEVRGDRLEIGVLDGYRLVPAPRVEVLTRSLEAVRSIGSGTLRLADLDGERFELEVVGSGDVEARGRVRRLVVHATGSGDLDLFRLVADEVEVRSTGSGDVHLNVIEELDVTCFGSGDVSYRGSPRLSRTTIGSGSVTAVGE